MSSLYVSLSRTYICLTLSDSQTDGQTDRECMHVWSSGLSDGQTDICKDNETSCAEDKKKDRGNLASFVKSSIISTSGASGTRAHAHGVYCLLSSLKGRAAQQCLGLHKLFNTMHRQSAY